MFWLTELLVCMGAVQLAVLVRFGTGADLGADHHFPHLTIATIVFGAVMTFSLVAFGLYQSHFRGGALGVLMRIALGFMAGSIALMILFYLFPFTYMGRGVTGIAVLVSFFTIGTIRPLFLPLVEQETLKRRVAIIGAGNAASNILNRLRRKADRRGFHIVNFLDFGEGVSVESDRVVKSPESMYDYCVRNDIQELVVALDDRRNGLPADQLIECRLKGIDVVEAYAFFEREAGFLPLDLVRPSWFIYAEGFRVGRSGEAMKRLTDIAASLLLLAVAWPVMILTALAIKIESKFDGPIFYTQERVGFGGKTFGVIKFRSMSVDAEKSGAQWATRNDSRVTRVGEIIRKMRIDELPQILNVLRGDMSLVGPRPERPVFVEELSTKVPYYVERHQVKPGLTGWAQVSYPYGASDEDARRKHEFDLYYVKNHTLFLDIFIMLQTVEVVILGKGAR